MKSFVPLALLATSALARTDLSGCTSYATVASNANGMYGTVIWYVPDTLEVCDFVDCGGGRAPPKSAPGCPLYEGTETITPSFLDHDPAKPIKTAEPESSAPETETSATATDVGQSEYSGIATAPTLTSSRSEETDSIATATAPDTSTITSMSTSVTTSPVSNSTTASEGGEDNDDDAATTTGTDSPGAAMPTAAVALNVVAGVAAAVAFL